MGQFASKPEPRRSPPPLLPPPAIPTTAYLSPGGHRRSCSLATGSRSRFSSSCPTPSATKHPEDYDDCRNLRRMLGAVHKICKNKPRQIEALCQSLNQTVGGESLDDRLVMFIRAFDHSVLELYGHLRLNLHFLHSFQLGLDLKEFTDSLGNLAVALEVWEKQVTRLTFSTADTNGQQKTVQKLRMEAKEIGEKFFGASGKIDTLSSIGERVNGQVAQVLADRTRGERTPSIVTLRACTRTPSPSAARGNLSMARPPSVPAISQSLQSPIEPAEQVGRGVGMVGIV